MKTPKMNHAEHTSFVVLIAVFGTSVAEAWMHYSRGKGKWAIPQGRELHISLLLVTLWSIITVLVAKFLQRFDPAESGEVGDQPPTR